MMHGLTNFKSKECIFLSYANFGLYIMYMFFLDDWLTVHRSITLVDIQLDALNKNFVHQVGNQPRL